MTIDEFLSLFWDNFKSVMFSPFGYIFLAVTFFVISLHSILTFIRFLCRPPRRPSASASDSDNLDSDYFDSDYFDSDSVLDPWEIPDKKI